MNMESLKSLGVDTDEIEIIIKGYCSGQTNIVVTGEFSSGKSSFINCFLNRKAFLPYGKTECTPILIDICEGNEGKIEVRKKDGNVYEEDLSNANIIKYARYVEGVENEVVSIAIPLNKSGLPENTHMIDTPGTNTILKEHEEITKFIIKRADAVLYLFNRVISKTDIEHINDILQYTTNIIYILTHSDEIDTKTGQKYTKERIEELIGEARKEISAGTNKNAEDLILCSVGSEYGFEDRSEFEEIKGLINSYIASQSKERRKRAAQKKIEKIIQAVLDEYLLKNELFSKQKEMSKHEIENKIKVFEKEQTNYNKSHNNRIEDIDRRIHDKEKLCKSELSRMLVEEKTRVLALISGSDVSEKTVENQLEKFNLEISAKMRKIIEESIMEVTKYAYDSANRSLGEIVGDFDISVPLMISAPEIKELDDSRISMQLASVEKQLEENLRELNILKENSTEDKKIDIEKQIHLCEIQKEKVEEKFLQLGTYHPEFISVKNEGWGNAGRVTGRIIGEVADLALLIWNPAGAAKGAADAAKGAAEAAKAVKIADQAKDAMTLARYMKNSIKNVDDGRRKIIEHVQTNADEEKDGVNLSTMLDMLSIGYWTEKLGGAIGEAIKPSKTTSVEDMENKAQYESKKNEIISEITRLSDELYDLQYQLNEVDDFGKQLRVENAMKEKNKVLEDKKRELEEMKSHAEKKNAEEQVKKHLESQFDEYKRAQLEKGVDLIQAILNKAKVEIIERLTIDYYEKLDYYKDTINELHDSLLSETEEMIEFEEQISKLQQSLSEVRMWLE